MAKKKAQFPLDQDPHYEREKAKYDKPSASREYILHVIEALGAPVDFDDIADAMGIPVDDDDANIGLDRRIRAMIRDGQLVRNRKDGLIPVDEKDLVRGRVSAHPDGFGFLIPDEGGEDLFIHAKQMDALFHHDHVVMRRAGENRRGKTEGRLVEIIERAHTHMVGEIFYEDSIAFMVPANNRITQDILIASDKTMDAQEGQLVKVEITHQPTRRHQAQGQVVEILGDPMGPGMEIEVAINSHNIPCEWPDEALAEAATLGEEVLEEDKQDRTDYRDLNLITIDGEDAKDFDDAVYCEKKENGWKLYVAIADVSHYVKVGSALDKEAELRATSVYFPGRVIPMLPESLSNGLCSLNPDVDRLCMMCEMHIDSDGKIQSYDFKEGVFRSKARTTYTQVWDMLQGVETVQQQFQHVLEDVKELHELYKVMREAREERGAIDFDTVETKIEFGENKKIEAIVPVIRNDAHKLIEECMIAANICAAKFIESKAIPALYRVHEDPDAEKYEDLRQFLMSFALSIPAASKPTVSMYADIVEKSQNRPESRLIQTVLLRSMKQAMYMPECKGHFGLALSHYAHFTSPIRRYPDLLVHRAIRHIIHSGTEANYTYSANRMGALGEECSTAERRATEATRDAMDWLKCEYMMDRVGETFTGMITGVAPFGIFVELEGVYVEGMVHVTNLDKDYFQHDPVGHRLIGERTNQVYRLSDKVKVNIVKVDLEDKRIELELAEDGVIDSPKREPKKRKRSEVDAPESQDLQS